MIADTLSSLEICAGGGGQALGLEQAGFSHEGLVEIDSHCCATLRLNRPGWQVFEQGLGPFVEERAAEFKGVDLLAGGLPCPPFSVAGKQLGDRDERNLFPVAVFATRRHRPSPGGHDRERQGYARRCVRGLPPAAQGGTRQDGLPCGMAPPERLRFRRTATAASRGDRRSAKRYCPSLQMADGNGPESQHSWGNALRSHERTAMEGGTAMEETGRRHCTHHSRRFSQARRS